MYDLRQLADRIRCRVMAVARESQCCHVGSCLSCVEILSVIYGGIVADPDRIILSKGHAVLALYAVLVETGLMDATLLDRYNRPGSPLVLHADHSVPGVPVSTGSLGHGLPIGCGIALADLSRRVVVVMSDAEMQCGTTWESAEMAAQCGLKNLLVVVDANGLSACQFLDNHGLAAKWKAFGWFPVKVNGHDVLPLHAACALQTGLPTVVIAKTVKGMGWPQMENKVASHYARLARE